jgi:hypothetical protein
VRSGCAKIGLSLGAQVFVDWRIRVLLLGHLEFQLTGCWRGFSLVGFGLLIFGCASPEI